MELTSLIQARMTYAGLFTGLYVAMRPIIEEDGYAASMPLATALADGLLAGVGGAFMAALIFSAIFSDRFWEVVFVAMPVSLGIGLILTFFEGAIGIFVFQPVLYTLFGALIGALVGFWLHRLFCGRRCGCKCGDASHD